MSLLKEAIEKEVRKVYLKRESIKETKFDLDLKNEKIMDKNKFKLGHLLLDLFEKFKLPLDINIMTDYDNLFVNFETPKHIVFYIEKELIKKDFVNSN